MKNRQLKRFLKRCGWRIAFFRKAGRLLNLINKDNSDPDYRFIFLHTLETLFRNLADENASFSKTTQDSKEIYEKYDDREILSLDEPEQVIKNGKEVVFMTAREIRRSMLGGLFESIERLLGDGEKKISILEVGCGNLMNAVMTTERFGDKVDYYGIDISENRIRNGLKHFTQLDPTHFSASSITERTGFDDRRFDIVFSMHCLEQISYETKAAIREMYRICNRQLVMVEPVYENGSFLQRTYLLTADHTRILLKSVQELGYHIVENRVCDIQSNMYNQSSVLKIDRQ